MVWHAVDAEFGTTVPDVMAHEDFLRKAAEAHACWSDKPMTAEEVERAIARKRAYEEFTAVKADCNACGHPFHAAECQVTVMIDGEKYFCTCEGYE